MAIIFAKTAAGQQEIGSRAHALPRLARTLLVLVDGHKSDEQLLQMVRGATVQDIASLREFGLIVPTAATTASVPAPTASSPSPSPVASAGPSADAAAAPAASGVPAADEPMSYSQLYDRLNRLVKEHLGLMKGYRYSLEIEKAVGMQGLLEVAGHFIADIEKAKGHPVAASLRRELGLGG